MGNTVGWRMAHRRQRRAPSCKLPRGTTGFDNACPNSPLAQAADAAAIEMVRFVGTLRKSMTARPPSYGKGKPVAAESPVHAPPLRVDICNHLRVTTATTARPTCWTDSWRLLQVCRPEGRLRLGL